MDTIDLSMLESKVSRLEEVSRTLEIVLYVYIGIIELLTCLIIMNELFYDRQCLQ